MDPATITALAQLAGPVLGAIGGGKAGDITVSQSATNATAVNLSNVLTNQSPGDVSAPASGNAEGGSSSGAGLAPSPLTIPFEGYGEGVSVTEPVLTGTGEPLPKAALLAAGVAVLGGAYLLFRKK